MLLKLPYLACKEVFLHMDTDTAFLLSFASKRAKTLVKVHARRKSIDLAIDTRNPQEVRVSIGVGNFFHTIICWSCNKIPKQLTDLKETVLSFGEETVPCSLAFDSQYNDPTIFCHRSHRHVLPPLIYVYIVDLFGKPFRLYLTMNHKRCHSLPANMTVEMFTITRQEHWLCPVFVNQTFRSVTVTDYVRIYPTVLEITKNSPLLSIKNLAIECLDVNCPKKYLIHFAGENAVFGMVLQNQDVIDFLKHWKSGQNMKLESIIVKTDSEISRNSILGSFEMKAWDVNRHPAKFEYSQKLAAFIRSIDRVNVFDSDCSGHMDIEREADGMLATVIITPNEFKFFVWKNTGRI